MKNKKGDVSILILVILIVALFGATLFIFSKNNDKINSTIKDARFLNNIYLAESQIDFYINEAIDMTFRKGYGDAGFVLAFKDNLRMFNKEEIKVSRYLVKIANEINEDDFQFGDEIIINIDIQIVDDFIKWLSAHKIITTYNYNKKFVRILNEDE
jgi:hypothetical protein